jgi:hypothetical protein
MVLNLSGDQKSACGRAADLITQQAEGLRLTGSTTTVAAFQRYAALLRRLANGEKVDLTEQDKVAIEQVTFVLEGMRDGLLTAEFRDRAKVIAGDIRLLNDIIAGYNAS